MICTVRRFSIIQQKEFGKIKDRLMRTIDLEKDRSKEISGVLRNRDKIHNSEIARKLEEGNRDVALIHNRNLVNDGSPISDDPPTKEEIKESKQSVFGNPTDDFMDLLLFLMKCHDEGLSTIFWNSDDGVETLAHEFGHTKNYKGNILDRFVHKGAKFGSAVKEKPGVIGALLSVLGDKFINWEERNASKKGYDLLKKYGLPPEDLKRAKMYMDYALEKYKSGSKIGWRDKLLKSKISKWL